MKRGPGGLYATPAIVWLTVFFIAPLFIIVLYSFLRPGLRGGVEWSLTFDAYRAIANPTFAKVTLNTIVVALGATLVTLLIALPCGYYMARSKNQTLLLLLVIIPFWTNFLIRIYAWIAILGNEGFLNDMLQALGLTNDSIRFLYNRWAVALVLVYTYLPYAILPLFSTIDKFDFSLLEAARDLGASKFGAIRRVLMPNIKGGVLTAFLFTFIPIFGAYAVPLLVGGTESYMLGNLIADELTKSRNWPLASAISLVITLVTTIGVMLLVRANGANVLGGGKEASEAKAEQSAPLLNASLVALPHSGGGAS
ncbi:MAG TPA: spermidine/putrescine ABC transporter permease [Spirochaetaceae bacterium]|jgi:spermidine/putrescine transport system permease protein|nr:spermidine/putrescine ABC transporter permease [Spirochaetaceae bacterium]